MKKITKKLLFSLFLLYVAVSFGCTAGKAPGVLLQPGEKIAVSRSISGNTVTLTIQIDPAEMQYPNTEIVLIAEEVPDTVTIVDGTVSVAPFVSDSRVMAWLFKVDQDQTLGTLTINQPVPDTITYEVSGVAGPSGFDGKWGVVREDAEGFSGGGEDCDLTFDHNSDGTVNVIDILLSIDMYVGGESVFTILETIEAYVGCELAGGQ